LVKVSFFIPSSRNSPPPKHPITVQDYPEIILRGEDGGQNTIAPYLRLPIDKLGKRYSSYQGLEKIDEAEEKEPPDTCTQR
jgi:hypothetical protein